MDPAVKILAKAMSDVVEDDDGRSEELNKTLRGDFNEYDLRPHFDEMSADEKAACSDRAENLAVAHTAEAPRAVVEDAPSNTSMSWGRTLAAR